MGIAMARPREFNEEQVLDAAMRIFWSKGYPGTSLQDIVEATGLERPSIYNAYGSKRGLFNRAFDLYSTNFLDGASKIIGRAPTARTAVDRLFRDFVAQQFDADRPCGCMAGLAANERHMHDATTHTKVTKLFRGLEKLVCDRLVAGRANAEFPDDFDARGTSTAVVCFLAGMITLRRSDFSKHSLQGARRAVTALLA